MRVGLIVPGFSATSEDWCIPALRQLAGALALKDHLRVLAVRYPFAPGRYQLFGAEVIALGGGERRGAGSGDLWRRVLAAIVAEHRRLKFDVLHAFWGNETGALAAIAGRILGIPTIVSLAGGELVGLPDIGYGGRLARTERWKLHVAMSLGRVVTAGSRYLMALAEKDRVVDPRKLRFAPLGVDTQLFKPPSTPIRGSRFRVVQVASLVPVKDQVTLLKTVAGLVEMGLPVRLEVAGGGIEMGRLRALATELSLGPAARFLGDLLYPQIPDFYRGAALAIQTSRHEAQGMAMLEAAACGVPLVGTEVGVVADLSPDAAIAVPCADHGALAAAVAELLTDPFRRASLAYESITRVQAEFELAATTDRFRELYAEVMS